MAVFKLIVAKDLHNGIGYRDVLPWYIPEDLKHFKELTKGGIVVMGAKTFESLPGFLPVRTHWVVTSRPLLENLPATETSSVVIFNSIAVVLRTAAKLPKDQVIWVIGGSSIYKQLAPYCNEAYVTIVEAKFETDTTFNLDYFWNDPEVLKVLEPTVERPFAVRFLHYVREH